MLAAPGAYREHMVTMRPEVTLRTTTGDDGGQALSVVAGYGPDPAAAIRSLTQCAKTEARVYLGDHPPCTFEVLGVSLVAGKVPDDRPDTERHAVRDGWAAIGTMVIASAARQPPGCRVGAAARIWPGGRRRRTDGGRAVLRVHDHYVECNGLSGADGSWDHGRDPGAFARLAAPDGEPVNGDGRTCGCSVSRPGRRAP